VIRLEPDRPRVCARAEMYQSQGYPRSRQFADSMNSSARSSGYGGFFYHAATSYRDKATRSRHLDYTAAFRLSPAIPSVAYDEHRGVLFASRDQPNTPSRFREAFRVLSPYTAGPLATRW